VSQPEWIVTGAGVIVLIILAQTIHISRTRKKSHKHAGSPVSSATGKHVPPLLTEPEFACFNMLHEVACKEYYVMAKVSLRDLAVVRRGVDKQLFKKVSGKHHHVDFVLCARKNMSVICAIELHDLSYDDDVGPSDLLEQVGIPVFSLPRKTNYSTLEIRKILQPFLKAPPPSPDEMVATISMEAFRSCKKCETRMMLKRARSGKHKGTLFWVCGKYPECRTIELFTR
jgi:hypothetical protein